MKTVLLSITAPLLIFSSFVFAANSNSWSVSGKSCNGRALPVLSAERVQFDSGFLAVIGKLPATDGQTCQQARVSTRLILEATTSSDGYTEVALVTPIAVRTVCKNIATGQTSDNTAQVSGAEQNMKLVLKNNQTGFLSIDNSSECPKGTLRLELVAK